jgi:hypothetical protein
MAIKNRKNENPCREYACCRRSGCDRPVKGRRWNLATLLIMLAIGFAVAGMLAMDNAPVSAGESCGSGSYAKSCGDEQQGAAGEQESCDKAAVCPVKQSCGDEKQGAAGEQESCDKAAVCPVKQSCGDEKQGAASEKEARDQAASCASKGWKGASYKYGQVADAVRHVWNDAQAGSRMAAYSGEGCPFIAAVQAQLNESGSSRREVREQGVASEKEAAE